MRLKKNIITGKKRGEKIGEMEGVREHDKQVQPSLHENNTFVSNTLYAEEMQEGLTFQY